MEKDEKVRENKSRRAAERQNLKLERSRRRDPRASDFNTYRLVDARSGEVVHSGTATTFGLSIEDVEDYLNRATG